jgi:hypothetical protein
LSVVVGMIENPDFSLAASFSSAASVEKTLA